MRRGLRDLAGWGLIVATLTVIGAGAWVSRHPDSAVVRRAIDWPLVGPLASSLRDRYGVGFEAREREDASTTSGRIVVIRRDAEVPEHGPIWIEPGLVDVAGPPPLGREPGPNLPLASRRAEPRRLRLALANLSGTERRSKLGPYDLITDVENDDLLRSLEPSIAGVESVYEARFGVRPIGEPVETIVLYSRASDYLGLRAAWEPLDKVDAAGHVGEGLVATHAEDRTAGQLAAILLHEVTHLLNRRALGPALPIWLEEGLAGDLAAARVTADGRFSFSDLLHERIDHENGFEIHGALAALALLVRDLGAEPVVEPMLDLEWSGFVDAGDISRNYAASQFLVRCLVQDGCGAVSPLAFTDFLRGVAAGRAAASSRLHSALGMSAPELESAFRSYVLREAAGSGVSAAEPINLRRRPGRRARE